MGPALSAEGIKLLESYTEVINTFSHENRGRNSNFIGFSK